MIYLFIALVASIFGSFVVLRLLRCAQQQEEQNHCWRPALTSHGPARTCICGETQQLTVEEFYAQFGIMPNVGITAK